MKIVIDTNVFISGLFFGGYPREVLNRLIDEKFTAFLNSEILDEYYEIIDRMRNKKQGHLNTWMLKMISQKFTLIDVTSDLKLCRDPDDDKFINCSIDAGALYIVSGDRDLLDLKNVENIKIATAKDFIELYFQS